MIEVEKKFQPTGEQLAKLLEGATLIKEKAMHDLYYDFPDYRLFKSGKRLRKRDNDFELKEYIPTESGVAIAHEYTDEAAILENLKVTERIDSLGELVQRYMQVACDFTTLRKEYHKDDFVIDVDEMDFGIGVTEIEMLVESEEQIADAGKRILNFARSFGIEQIDLPLKTEMYLQKIKPDIYKEIFGTKDIKFGMH